MAPHGEQELQKQLDAVREQRIQDLQQRVAKLEALLFGDGTPAHPGIAHTVVEMGKDVYEGPNSLMDTTRELKYFKIRISGYVAGVVGVIMVADKVISHLLK